MTCACYTCNSYMAERKILDGISFFVPAGKSVAIIGTSGSGKVFVDLNSSTHVTMFMLVFYFYGYGSPLV